MTHRCHAQGCTLPIPPEKLMCRRHWLMVPKALRSHIWATYRPGQCGDKRPAREYLEYARAAISAVAEKERAVAALIPTV